jgi:hypothetical protein
MILYFLTHVAEPPVLPNLQTIPNRGVTKFEDVECEGCNIYFSPDGNGWKSQNTEVYPETHCCQLIGSLLGNSLKDFSIFLHLNGISRIMSSQFDH